MRVSVLEELQTLIDGDNNEHTNGHQKTDKHGAPVTVAVPALIVVAMTVRMFLVIMSIVVLNLVYVFIIVPVRVRVGVGVVVPTRLETVWNQMHERISHQHRLTEA